MKGAILPDNINRELKMNAKIGFSANRNTTARRSIKGLRPGSITSVLVEAAKRRPRAGMTREELFHAVNGDNDYGYQTVSGRVSDLQARGVLLPTGKTRKMKDTGATGSVLVLNPVLL